MDYLLACVGCGFGLGLFVALPYLLGWGRNDPVLLDALRVLLKSMLPRALKKHASKGGEHGR